MNHSILAYERAEAMEVWGLFLSVWNYNVFAVDGNGVSFGKIVAGIILFIFGIALARKISGRIEKRFLMRMDIDASVRYNLRSIILYLLVIFNALFVMRLLNIPLTVFAVAGGALAIGIGFGSQNIVNNFISGLIIMVERPVRVGDVIEIGDLSGTVEQIGARSTRVKTALNTRIIVPNSTFLEKNIVNWTLGDKIVRCKVSLDVSYNNKIQQVIKVLTEIALEDADVVKHPVPMVVVSDFSENAIKFDVFYWAQVGGSRTLVEIASDIRIAVHGRFEKEQLSLAYPKKASPTQIQVLSLPPPQG